MSRKNQDGRKNIPVIRGNRLEYLYYSSAHNQPNALRQQASPRRKVNTKKWLIWTAVLLVGFFVWQAVGQKDGSDQKATLGASKAKQAPTTNQKKYDIDTPGSQWVVVNKSRSIPAHYTPANLAEPHVPLRLTNGDSEMTVRPEVATALEQLVQDAKQQGYELMLGSGYRSYERQQTVYNQEVQSQGAEKANLESAKPGTSEHQTGLALDIDRVDRKCEFQTCFGGTLEGQWIAKKAHNYGFIVRYPASKQSSTGYGYEPWHLRFVGKELATQLYTSGQTLEEYFGL